jgi:glyoxylase-like metal-dependent hydrolase (beta-lactamase superfamily II)
MNELFVLQIVPGWGNEANAVHPVLLRDETHLALIDCGFVDSYDLLVSALAAHGFSSVDLTHVILTHHDHDHVGTLATLKRSNPRIQIVSSASEAPYLAGTIPALRLTQARAIQPTLTGDAQAAGLAFLHLLEQVEPAAVDWLIRDGDVLPFCGGCNVLATPGHTLGHVSLYLPALDTLIAGDAAVLEAGRFALANPQFAEDLALAEQSFQRIVSFCAETIVCYHGGVLNRKKNCD